MIDRLTNWWYGVEGPRLDDGKSRKVDPASSPDPITDSTGTGLVRCSSVGSVRASSAYLRTTPYAVTKQLCDYSSFSKALVN